MIARNARFGPSLFAPSPFTRISPRQLPKRSTRHRSSREARAQRGELGLENRQGVRGPPEGVAEGKGGLGAVLAPGLVGRGPGPHTERPQALEGLARYRCPAPARDEAQAAQDVILVEARERRMKPGLVD